VQGRLRLKGETGTVELTARVVEYRRSVGALYSWHGRLEHYDQQQGLLSLDDGREIAVLVDQGLLRQMPAAVDSRD
jgi:hypothetical protein